MNKNIKTAYLVLASLGILTALPILGGIIDSLRILALIMLVLSIYILTEKPKDQSDKIGAILMLISSVLVILEGILELGNLLISFSNLGVGSFHISSTITNSYAMIVTMFSSVIGFPVWILRIVAIVFSLKTYNEIKS